MGKKENAQKMLEFIEDAWKSSPSIVLMTDDYVYALWPLDEERKTWKEVSFVFEDGSLEISEHPAHIALQLFIKEVSLALPNYKNVVIAAEDREKLNKILKRIEEFME
ncbi:MAG: hypothetical protein ACTSV7_02770 [Candidatus Baldrarchaeia archaeon]|nr:hypothetical protein [Candidatus Baldrarchaeota archaeon]